MTTHTRLVSGALVSCMLCALFSATSFQVAAQEAQQKPAAPTQAARPQRTEAEARQLAEKHRQERARLRKDTGKPVELISDYVAAQLLPVPPSLGVSPFYTKYVDAQGIPVLASDKVPDAALLVARDIVNSMLAMRPDLRKAMIARKWRTGVIAEVEMTMDIPEYAEPEAARRAARRADQPGRTATITPTARAASAATRRRAPRRISSAIRTRATGASTSSCTSSRTRSWAAGFATSIRRCSPRSAPPTTRRWPRASTSHLDGRKHYATTNAGEYWAEGVQWWFFSNYGECFAGNVKVETPEEFAAYDPKLNELIGRVFNTHRIPMDVFHGKLIRPVRCPA